MSGRSRGHCTGHSRRGPELRIRPCRPQPRQQATRRRVTGRTTPVPSPAPATYRRTPLPVWDRWHDGGSAQGAPGGCPPPPSIPPGRRTGADGGISMGLTREGMDRRTLLEGAAVIGGAAWVAPTIGAAMSPASASGGSGYANSAPTGAAPTGAGGLGASIHSYVLMVTLGEILQVNVGGKGGDGGSRPIGERAARTEAARALGNRPASTAIRSRSTGAAAAPPTYAAAPTGSPTAWWWPAGVGAGARKPTAPPRTASPGVREANRRRCRRGRQQWRGGGHPDHRRQGRQWPCHGTSGHRWTRGGRCCRLSADEGVRRRGGGGGYYGGDGGGPNGAGGGGGGSSFPTSATFGSGNAGNGSVVITYTT